MKRAHGRIGDAASVAKQKSNAMIEASAELAETTVTEAAAAVHHPLPLANAGVWAAAAGRSHSASSVRSRSTSPPVSLDTGATGRRVAAGSTGERAVRVGGHSSPPEPCARLWRDAQGRSILLTAQLNYLSRLKVEQP